MTEMLRSRAKSRDITIALAPVESPAEEQVRSLGRALLNSCSVASGRAASAYPRWRGATSCLPSSWSATGLGSTRVSPFQPAKPSAGAGTFVPTKRRSVWRYTQPTAVVWKR